MPRINIGPCACCGGCCRDNCETVNVTITPVTDGTCSTCDELIQGTHALTGVADPLVCTWGKLILGMMCPSSGTFLFELNWNDGTWSLSITRLPNTPAAFYEGEGPCSQAATLDFVNGATFCNWPTTASIAPQCA